MFDSKGAAAGWGPTDDPQGLFKGQATKQSDVWLFETVPPKLIATAFAGGSFKIDAASDCVPGNYAIGYSFNGAARSLAVTVT